MHKVDYRPDIDGLRTIAILSVLLFHVDISGFGIEFSGGFVGVDIFFVITGFLITGNIINDVKKGSFSFSRFYIRRIRRLFPAFLFMISTVFIAAYILFSPEDFERLSESLVYAIFSLSNFYF